MPHRSRNGTHAAGLVMVALFACLPLGCDEREPAAPAESITSLQVRQPGRDHFALAMDFLEQRNEYNLDRAARQTTYHLNRWIQDQAADARWMLDRRLINTLPGVLLRAPATKTILADRALAKLEFDPSDVLFLEQNQWLHAVSEWAINELEVASLQQALEQSKLPTKTAKQLAVCTQLFDWTIRNIQLKALLPYPKQAAAGPSNLVDSNNPAADWPPPMRAIPGPGYQHTPWQLLMFGRGDMLERARLFILLCRQRHIDAVMLGTTTKTGRPKPWLPAVLLDKQLYLFDPELGLPIPGPDGQPIATLQQVIDTPALLDSLSIGAKYTYRFSSSDLDRVVALIDASPESMSQRMKVLEGHLDAAHEMVLTTAPTRIKRALEALKIIHAVQLWAVPLEAEIYREVHAVAAANNAQIGAMDFTDHGILTLGLNPVVMGRRQHLRGNFQGQGDIKGAITRYLEARSSNAAIEAMSASEVARKEMGLVKPQDMPERVWQERIQREQFLHIQAKQDASFWIGLIQYEQGNYDVASNWFKKRTLDAWPGCPWETGAKYNLARCKEQLGQLDEARALYLIDDSPQRHGNLLRARQLEAKIAGNRAAETTPKKAGD